MNKREIALLWEVAVTGSVTRAAERVHISQPAASAALRSIEDKLGFALFLREKRRLVLTAKGRSLLPELSNALAALASLDRLAEELSVETASRINIGCVAAASTTILPAAVHRLRESVPRARVVVRTALAVDIANMVAERRVDFGMIVGDAMPPGAGVADIASFGLYGLMPPDYALARKKSLSLLEVSRHPYVTLSRQLQIGSLIARKFEETGLAYSPSVEVMQFSAACAFAEAGYGIALLDALSIPLARKLGLVAVPLNLPDRIPFRLIWAKGAALEKYADTLQQALKDAVDAI